MRATVLTFDDDVVARTPGPGVPIGITMVTADSHNVLYNKNVTDPSNKVAASTLVVNGAPVTFTTPTTAGQFVIYNGAELVFGTYPDTFVGTNTRYGDDALKATTTGTSNCAFGYHSLVGVTTGSDNCGCGYGTFRWANTQSRCIAIGSEVLWRATAPTGDYAEKPDDVIAIGHRAMYRSGFTWVDPSIAIGAHAGESVSLNSSGVDSSVMIGAYAGRLVSNDYGHIVSSLFGNGAGSNHQMTMMDACGYRAGAGNSALSAGHIDAYCAALGAHAYEFVTTPPGAQFYNCALGAYALYDPPNMLDGVTAVGYEALMSIADSTDNVTAFGHQVGKSLTNCAGTTLFGHRAAMIATSGITQCTIVGSDSAFSMTTGATANTYVGGVAGQLCTTGTNNIGIGYNAGNSTGTLSDSIALGSGAQTATAGSAKLSLGSSTIPLATITTGLVAGAANAPTGNPVAYLIVRINQVTRKVPLWTAP